MIRKLASFILILLLAFGSVSAQTKYFGKNKVQYQNFDWQYLQTRHFDIYFADQMYENAKFAADVLESSYVTVSEELNYNIQRRIPVFIYNSPNEFQQTNIIPSFLPEGVGGFTEAFKNRIAIPFNGSVEDFRHVLHHELTHAVTYDLLFGNVFTALLSRQRLFNMPLWLSEGYAEYSSRYGWDYYADMVVRDATINNYLIPPQYLSGYLAYKEGQALINYIADRFGEKKVGEIFVKGKVLLTINKALKASLGMTEKELWEEFSKEMKRRYWPEIAKREEASEAAKQLTDHTKDASNFNSKPIFSPKGDRLAIFSDRSDYIEIYLISVVDGEIIDRLVKAERTGDLESLHSYLSGITFSPDGEQIAFVVKKSGKDAIYFLNVDNKKIFKRKYFDFNSILYPVWSPDGTKLAFAALNDGKRDIVIYDIEKDVTRNICNDGFDDMDPSWFPDSKTLAFSSDRPHPDNDFILKNPNYAGDEDEDLRTIYNDFGYGNYNLFRIDAENGKITPINCGPGMNREPSVSPDGNSICFVSNRNGIDNLYINDLTTSNNYAITDILTGVGSPNWSPDGKIIAFSAFNQAGFDVFLLKDWQPAGDNGILEPTDYVRGLYEKDTREPLDEKPDVDEEGVIATGEESIDDAPADVEDYAEPVPGDTTRIVEGDFVFVSDEESKIDPLESIFEEVSDDTLTLRRSSPDKKRAAVFDSIAEYGQFESGEYKVHDYKTRFTPDYVSGGFSYDTFFGLRGQSVFVFSDYLGDHQILFATDLVNTLDQTNFQLFYLYNRMRYNLGAGIFHTKNFYLDPVDRLFSDRFYGFQAYWSWPFSQFSRIEAIGSQYFIDRKYHEAETQIEDRSSRVTTGMISLVKDNIIWGITGPLNGRRSRIDIEGAVNLFGSTGIEDISFYSIEADYRKYLHINGLFSLAYRLSGGASWGSTPKRYFLGGTENKIGSTTGDVSVYDVENLYFSEIITPMRGYNYFDLQGDRYFLLNLEFRYPFIDYLKMNFPLPLTIGYLTGNMFFDMGAAWNWDDGFKGGSSEGGAHLEDIKTAFGCGMRANLGIFVLRYDVAWRFDFRNVAERPEHYFSIGADF
jgi:Tol biopolymer transport system component